MAALMTDVPASAFVPLPDPTVVEEMKHGAFEEVVASPAAVSTAAVTVPDTDVPMDAVPSRDTKPVATLSSPPPSSVEPAQPATEAEGRAMPELASTEADVEMKTNIESSTEPAPTNTDSDMKDVTAQPAEQSSNELPAAASAPASAEAAAAELPQPAMPASSPSLSKSVSFASASPSPSPENPYYPFGDPATRPYAGNEADTLRVRWLYRAVNFLTELFFGVDKDLDHLPEKRRSIKPKQTETGADLLAPNISLLPPSISAGYGELSWQGFDKLLYWMETEAPEEVRLGPTSRFLDIGSGFGKCIFHAKLRAKVRRSIGVECIKTRHEKAREALHLLRAGFVPGLSDAKDAPSFEQVRDLNLDGCELFEGDISLPKFHPLMCAATHIYAFDVVFSRATHAKILPIVEACDFRLFGCYLNPQKLAAFGCTRFQLVHTIKVHTTGKQSFTCYFYIKSPTPTTNATAATTTPPTSAPALPPELADLDPASDAFWTQMHEMTKDPEPYIAEAHAALDAVAAGKPIAPNSSSASPNGDTPAKRSHKKKGSTNGETTTPRNGKTSKRSRSRNNRATVVESEASESEEEEESPQPAKRSHQKKGTSAARSRSRSKTGRSRGRPRKRKSDGEAAVAASSEDESDASERSPSPPPVKKLSRSQLFDMALAAAMAPKPKVPRRTNNTLAVRIDGPLPESIVPKMLTHYLADPVRPPQPLGLDDDETMATTTATTNGTTAAAAAAAPTSNGAPVPAAATANGTTEVAAADAEASNKKPKLEHEADGTAAAATATPAPRKRGRPRKIR